MGGLDISEVEPIPSNLYYKNCRCCGRKNVPFEQKSWTACLLCTIETREFQINGAFNPRNHFRTVERTEKLLNNYLELIGILRFSDIWKQAKLVSDAGFAEIIYDGRKQAKDWAGLRLTESGKKVLGRIKL